MAVAEPAKLCPAQRECYDALMGTLHLGQVYAVWSGTGLGKTTVLREIQRATGAAFLNMRDFVGILRQKHPLAIEETYERMVLDALDANDMVIVDDLHLITGMVGCNHFYFRKGLFDAPLTTLATYAQESGKKLILAMEGSIPGPIRQRSYPRGISKFGVADYEFLCRLWLSDDAASNLSYAKIHRFAPKLNAHQLKSACGWLRQQQELTTDEFIDYLRSQRMTSNVDLGEVQAVDLHDLKGVDDVIESLEANIILPLENDALAAELDIKPKRGVLLAGPPGTGKTTIGRALAHRLKSKFFLVDGTFISGTRDFYQQVQQVFETAKHNAPAIIFIDDSDVIFESGKEMGLYRYLLTMLDGLESESAGRVCVMMTAMDIGNLPPALIRSGRVELWLETRLPDAPARQAILEGHLARLPDVLSSIEVEAVVGATDGFTGADMKRLVDDAKVLYAYDKARQRKLSAPTDYFLAASKTVRENKERYTRADAMARHQKASRPPWFDIMGAMGMDGPDVDNE